METQISCSNESNFENAEYKAELGEKTCFENYCKREKILRFKVLPKLSIEETKYFKEKLIHRKDVTSIYSDNYQFSLQVTNKLYVFTRSNGIIATCLPKNHEFIIKNKIVLKTKEELSYKIKLENQVTKYAYTSLRFLVNLGCLKSKDALTSVILLWKKRDEIEHFKEMIRKFENKCSNANKQTRHDFSNINFLEDENLLKEKIHGNKTNGGDIFVYFANDIIKYIKAHTFDMLFIDGTHLNVNEDKNQMLMFRLFSSKSQESITSVYSICHSKKQCVYETIIQLVNETGVLDNIQFIMTDFELE